MLWCIGGNWVLYSVFPLLYSAFLICLISTSENVDAKFMISMVKDFAALRQRLPAEPCAPLTLSTSSGKRRNRPWKA